MQCSNVATAEAYIILPVGAPKVRLPSRPDATTNHKAEKFINKLAARLLRPISSGRFVWWRETVFSLALRAMNLVEQLCE